MGVYRRTTQPLENSLDSFSFDEDYLDDDYESIPSLWAIVGILNPKTLFMLITCSIFFIPVLMTILAFVMAMIALIIYLRLRRQQLNLSQHQPFNPVYAHTEQIVGKKNHNLK